MAKQSLLIRLSIILTIVAVSCCADTVTFVNGTTYVVNPDLTGFATNGDMMAGMVVTAYYGATSSTAIWAATGGLAAGAASNANFSLALSGDTFSSNWGLTNLATDPMTGLVINGPPGRTIFDVCLSPPCSSDTSSGTPSSARGWTFERNGGTFAGSVDATYSDLVAITGNAPVGDLWANLALNFNGGLGNQGTVTWLADADSVPLSGTINPVPEPASVLLLGTMCAAVFALRRKWA